MKMICAGTMEISKEDLGIKYYDTGWLMDAMRYLAVKRPVPTVNTGSVPGYKEATESARHMANTQGELLGYVSLADLKEWAGEPNIDKDGWKEHPGKVGHPVRDSLRKITDLNRGLVARGIAELEGINDTKMVRVSFIPKREEPIKSYQFLTFDVSGWRITVAPVKPDVWEDDCFDSAPELKLVWSGESSCNGYPVSELNNVKGIGISARKELILHVQTQHVDFV